MNGRVNVGWLVAALLLFARACDKWGAGHTGWALFFVVASLAAVANAFLYRCVRH